MSLLAQTSTQQLVTSSITAVTAQFQTITTQTFSVSSINGIVPGAAFNGSTMGLSSATVNTSSLVGSNIKSVQGYISSLVVDSLAIGSNSGYINMGDIITTSISSLQINTGLFTASGAVCTPQLVASTINGLTLTQLAGQPIQSTVIGLATAGYISTSQLYSTVQGIGSGFTGSTIGLSAATINVSTLNTVYISSVQGYVSSFRTDSLTVGGPTGYVSIKDLTTATISTGQIVAGAGFISSLQINSLSFGPSGYVIVGDVIANSLSTKKLNTQALYANNAYIGNVSTQSAILFPGIDGSYRGTAIAEQTTGVGTQELLLYKVSSTTDQIRMQTTGNMVFEVGAPSRSWNSTTQLATPTLYIQGSTSNVGVGTATPAATLDVVGTGRFQTVSSLSLNVSTVNGIVPSAAFNGSITQLSTGTVTASNITMSGAVNMNTNPISNAGTISESTYVSNMVLWFDAADTTTLFQDGGGATPVTANNQNVYLWKDKSVFATNATIATGVPKSAYNAQNSKNGIAFNNNSGFQFSSANMPGGTSSNATYFFVAQQATNTTILFSTGDPNQSRCLASTENNGGMQVYIDGVSPSGPVRWNGNTPHIQTLVVQSAQLIRRSDGAQLDSTTITSAAAVNTGNGLISATFGGLTSYWNGNIYEIIVFNTPLSSTYMQQIEGYLAWKWNITLNAAHPYYAVSPGITPNASGTLTQFGSFGLDTANNIQITASNALRLMAPVQIPTTLAVSSLTVSSINSQTFGQPIQSTVIGLGTAGYISTSQLYSTVTGIGSGFTGSTVGLSAATIGVSTINSVYISSIQGYVSSFRTDSLTVGGPTGYVSIKDLTTATTSTGQIVAGAGFISSLQINSLSFGPSGYVIVGDVIANSLSTKKLNTQALYTNNAYIGNTSTQSAILFPGIDGNYRGTAVAEQTTGVGTGELLLYKVSSTTDQIRLQTTGNIVFEAGAASRSWPSTAALATPTLYIQGSSSNVGIGTAAPAATLDVVGTGRFQTLSSLALNVSSINGAAPGGGATFNGSTTTLSSAVINVSSLSSAYVKATQGYISSLTVDYLAIGSNVGYMNMGDIITTSHSSLQINTGTLMASGQIQAQTLSTLTLNVSSINGAAPGGGATFNGSTTSLSAATIYVSSFGANTAKTSSLTMYGILNMSNNPITNVYSALFASLYAGGNPNASAGGTYTTYISGSNTYAVHSFTNTGTTNFTPVANIIGAQVLVVGGGGSGGGLFLGGGGGAGGLVYATGVTITSAGAPYPIVVGVGGAAASGGPNVGGNNGGSSSAFGYSGAGGGGGGSDGSTAAKSGGCGGGGGYGSGAPPASGTQGYGGGTGSNTLPGNGGGGGGGMGSAGSNYNSANTCWGGNGVVYAITGSNVGYAAGGGGGSQLTSAAASGGLANGVVIGGYGGYSPSKLATAGAANTGSGGGGNGEAAYSGAGGSGIVIIAYAINQYSFTQYNVGIITGDANSNLSIQPTNTLNIVGATQVSTFLTASSFSTSFLNATIMSTPSLQVSTINGVAVPTPFVGSTNFISATTIQAPLLSTLNINLSSINGTAQWQQSYLTSTSQGLGTAGYVSTTQLASTVTNLITRIGAGGGGGGTTFVDSTTFLSASQILFSTQTGYNISSVLGFVSSLQVDELQIGTGFGIIAFGDTNMSSISTLGIAAGLGNFQTINVSSINGAIPGTGTGSATSNFGTVSSLTALRFYGLTGGYTNTVIAEVSTGTGTQELLLYKVSSIADQVRVQTTGNVIFETGVGARGWPVATRATVPTFYIAGSNSNVGIGTSNPLTTLDVAGTGRFQTLSSLNITAGSINYSIAYV